MNYVLQYPGWTIVACFLAGLLYAVVLYFKERNLEGQASYIRWMLGFLRFGAITILCILLLGILIPTQDKIVEKPIIIVGQDNSGSIVSTSDSSYYKGQYKKQLEALTSQLSSKYQLEFFRIGAFSDISRDIDFKDKQSDIGSFFDEITDRYAGRNIGAVVLLSDGIYNKGGNPLALSENIHNTPIFTVALGDTSVKRDLRIEKLNHNKVAYQGNDFPVEVLVKADRLKGKSTKLRIFYKNEIIESKDIEIEQSVALYKFNFRIEAKNAGLQRYTVVLDSIDNEINYGNNATDFVIDVQNNRQEILLFANSPHPDIAVIRNVIEAQQSYKLDLKYAGDQIDDIKRYGLIILHQIPSVTATSQDLLNKIQNLKKPVLFMLGGQNNFGLFNQLKSGVSHLGFRGQMDAVNAEFMKDFTSFSLPPELFNVESRLPVMHVPFGNYKISNGVTAIANQKLGNLSKNEALMAINKWNGVRTGFILGEGIWRWKIKYASLTNSLVHKLIQYLVTREDKSFFRINSKREFTENEDVSFEAELYNDSYELVNSATVNIIVSSEQGEEYPFTFAPSGSAYTLNAGRLPAGTYNFKANVRYNGNDFERVGQFSVKSLTIEQNDLVADHNMLYQISSNSGGKMIPVSELDKLADDILSSGEIVDVSYPIDKQEEIINWKWIFFVLVALLSLEWFVRKRNGAY